MTIKIFVSGIQILDEGKILLGQLIEFKPIKI